MVTFNGITQSLPAWSKQLGYSDRGAALHYRIKHWGIDKALTTPAPSHLLITYGNETHNLYQWAKILHTSPITLRRRIEQVGIANALIGKYRRNERHGLSRTPEYRIWCAMIDRCYNDNHKQYKGYGGRGISVCDEWRKSFVAFIEHIGNRPDPKLVLDRINNDGDYEPGNVRWTTRSISQYNRRCNHRKPVQLSLDFDVVSKPAKLLFL